jgi:hypothetical protein
MDFPITRSPSMVNMMVVDYEAPGSPGSFGIRTYALHDGRILEAAVTLTKEEVVSVMASMEAWLRDKDPAYNEYAAARAAMAQGVIPDADIDAMPATDAEYAEHLAEGCASQGENL